MKTVHIIMNAHIDPIWLWPWTSGLDETLATCRCNCDLLDEYDDLCFTRGEAWGYQLIERIDPVLFERIKVHIASGRWEVIGGWWIQPDCNAPSGFGFERQISLGKQYCLDRFGTFPKIAYNVDSFGHAATLPGYMRAAGQEYYVMMRPQQHECSLPANLFRWQGFADGAEVTTFRIPGGYCSRDLSNWHIENALASMPAGIEHTMCFTGVGDHGGGATASLIDWVRAHAHAFPDVELQFSTPSRFFEALTPAQRASLPLVTGELQMHAVGCYSVNHPIKAAVRKAEHQLRQAELMQSSLQQQGIVTASLHDAWQHVCFNHFHDALGGTSIPSATTTALAQLGAATTVADEQLTYGLRQLLQSLPDDSRQRVVLYNASDAPYSGYAEVEPWLAYQAWDLQNQLLDEHDQPVCVQRLQQEAVIGGEHRLLFRTSVPAGGLRVYRIVAGGGAQTTESGVLLQSDSIETTQGNGISLGAQPGLHFAGGVTLPLPRLDLLPDYSDNWSHTIDRYPAGPAEAAIWDAPCLLDYGPNMASLLQHGHIGQSRLQAEWRVYADEPFVELRLRVHWFEQQRLLKYTLPLLGSPTHRTDGIPGASLPRPLDGREYPLRDWTLLAGDSTNTIAVVCPDVYALDVHPWQARLTLLRSPIVTDHNPGPVHFARVTFADQGEHTFSFRFFAGTDVDSSLLDAHALMLQRPLLMADLTRGMPRNYT